MTQKRKYFIETYGCQMNQYDSELVAGILEDKNYTSAESYEEADAIFVNTCAIREGAEHRVLSRLGQYKIRKDAAPNTIIGVLGCMAQNLKDKILTEKPYVDFVLGPDAYRNLSDMLDQYHEDEETLINTRLSRHEVYEGMFPARKEGINAWIAITRGCDKFCTFCIVPYTRGRERSRSVESIIEEVKRVVEQGYVEITLLGQNVNSYQYENYGFAELLEEVSAVKDVKRIRYTSPHPQDIDDNLLQVMASNPKICNHIHLPLQSGSTEVLERMNRTYTRTEYLMLVDKIRSYMPDCGITTDIIVGFPGETDEQFQETVSMMRAVRYDNAFMFQYSARPYTKAIEYEDSVPNEVKSERLQRVIQVQNELTLENNRNLVGSTAEVLVEKDSKKSGQQWMGRTDENRIVVFDKNGEGPRDLVQLEITDARGVTLFGKHLN
ncbi:MAG: tRNA (N6-isopentenyl adenosine(37)-C2)-methylthiotransferase MiaB [Candidatus Marinimicrobia bacterium]|nr:tRNA (N6-isopentenyl adenosine(37)-C2)-methylthiotransferase MiaB [Candidatus Neomarinimicrobiota bacterium]